MDILKALHQESSKLQQQLDSINGAIQVLGGTTKNSSGNGRKHRTWKMSAEARAKISRAQRKRWRERKKAKSNA